MAAHDPREVIVDSEDIHWSPTGWNLDGSVSRGGQGFATTGEASLWYSFHGSKGRIVGTTSSYESSKEKPPWTCFLDGNPVPNTSMQTKKNWALCEWDSNTPVGPHTITLNFTQEGENAIRFNRLLYQPDATHPVHNATIYVHHSDPAIIYGSGWKMKDDNHIARSGAANLSLSFVGSGLWWFRDVSNQSTGSHTAQSIQYSIDHGPLKNVSIDGDSRRNAKSSQNKWLFFQTDELELGQHNLTVLTQGFSNLTLSHLVLANSETEPSIPSIDTSNPTSTSTTPETSASKPSSRPKHDHGTMTYKKKMILGFVVGGLVLFFLVLFVFMFYRRRRIRMNKIRSEESVGTSQYLKSDHQSPTLPAILSHKYPFARQSPAQLRSNQHQVNPTTRLTISSASSSSTRANSLFPIARLSALPTKGEPDTPRTYRPYVSRRFRFSNFSSNSRQTTSSSVTLLPSPKRSFVSLPDDDRTVVMGHRNTRLPEPLPPYSKS